MTLCIESNKCMVLCMVKYLILCIVRYLYWPIWMERYQYITFFTVRYLCMTFLIVKCLYGEIFLLNTQRLHSIPNSATDMLKYLNKVLKNQSMSNCKHVWFTISGWNVWTCERSIQDPYTNPWVRQGLQETKCHSQQTLWSL